MGIKINIAGQKFDKLTAIKEQGRSPKNQVLWLCRCDCGKESIVSCSNLRSGHIRSCGCIRIGVPSHKRNNPPIGSYFKDMKIIGICDPYVAKDGGKSLVLKLICSCGCEFNCMWSNLKSNGTKSCGCKRWKKRGGHTTEPLYSTWKNMKERCYTMDCISYKYYGGRGILVCKSWRDDFYSFRKWALNNGWRKGLQIDRIKNEKGYSPSNCRIVTPKENMANRRKKTKKYEY